MYILLNTTVVCKNSTKFDRHSKTKIRHKYI